MVANTPNLGGFYDKVGTFFRWPYIASCEILAQKGIIWPEFRMR